MKYKKNIKREYFKNEKKYPYIYCLMVTGKDNNRIDLAKKSLKNFRKQNYPNKRLVILNHNTHYNVQNNENSPEIFEFVVDKNKKTLGHLRNILLNFVPINSLWTTWDDDDIRDNNYLSYLFKHLKDKNVDCVAFQNRVEFNIKNKFMWISQLKPAYKFVLCKYHPSISYLDRNSLEDINLLKNIKDIGYSIYCIDNDPYIYIRLNHNNNTSIYIQKNKKKIKNHNKHSSYNEFEIKNEERKYNINKKVNDFFE